MTISVARELHGGHAYHHIHHGGYIYGISLPKDLAPENYRRFPPDGSYIRIADAIEAGNLVEAETLLIAALLSGEIT